MNWNMLFPILFLRDIGCICIVVLGHHRPLCVFISLCMNASFSHESMISPRDVHILHTSTSGASAEMSPHIVPLPESEMQCLSSTKAYLRSSERDCHRLLKPFGWNEVDLGLLGITGSGFFSENMSPHIIWWTTFILKNTIRNLYFLSCQHTHLGHIPVMAEQKVWQGTYPFVRFK